jgi:hypothetical protein
MIFSLKTIKDLRNKSCPYPWDKYLYEPDLIQNTITMTIFRLRY